MATGAHRFIATVAAASVAIPTRQLLQALGDSFHQALVVASVGFLVGLFSTFGVGAAATITVAAITVAVAVAVAVAVELHRAVAVLIVAVLIVAVLVVAILIIVVTVARRIALFVMN